ncbi:hypothetical protein [Sulfobacillus harzensis]|uniref:Heat induced stress protein YflT n=1 Tax=Sulfobacillus harzensis TaxID=2729629 RepID=A0A7Y0Q1Z4_9FIRM|nr:hypothetical protein [Sulfobacillus harzensis]NMP21845.1 hypothetical protein [Sulfobacillus harzensis]
MAKTVVGSFSDQHAADTVVHELEHNGVDDKKISVIARHDGHTEKGHPTGHGTHDLSSGIGWGAATGGAVGLLASAGALAIPGVGPILAMGPLAATLSGAAAGGLVGGLMDYGIPKGESEHLEQDVKHGNVLVMVQTDEPEVEKAQRLFKDHGAHDVYVH